MADRIIRTPLDEAGVRALELGEVVYLDGMVYTMRDEAHLRALELHERGQPLPVDLHGAAVYHCGPITTRDDGGWRMVAAGPTTSARMNSLEPRFIETFGVRAIIGKGGMDRATLESMRTHGCVYLAITGGAAVLAARGVEAVEGVDWLDLGMPEALWHLRCLHLGPLIVAMDAHGNSIYQDVEKAIAEGEKRAKVMLGI